MSDFIHFWKEIEPQHNFKDLEFFLLLNATLFFSFHYDMMFFLILSLIFPFSACDKVTLPPHSTAFKEKIVIIIG